MIITPKSSNAQGKIPLQPQAELDILWPSYDIHVLVILSPQRPGHQRLVTKVPPKQHLLSAIILELH